jgi:NADH-quinone oxidoreductase subunit H
VLAFVPGALAFAIIPVGNQIGDTKLQVASLHVGILFSAAVVSLSAYGIAFGGWASNSKYPLLGAVRSSAQLISYEVVMGLSLISIIMTYGTVRTEEMVTWQTTRLADSGPLAWVPAWGIFVQPLAFVLFLVAAFAENNRLPFDMPECEAELVGGYHTEYSSMKFSLFFLGEYAAMFSSCCITTTLFLGGYTLPGMDLANHGLLFGLWTVAVFLAKVSGLLFLFILVRWTLPRFRFDQLMHLGWKTLIPLGLVNLMISGAIAQA